MTTTARPSFVYVTYISTTPEKVWDALIDGEMTKLYWGLHRNVSDWKVGSPWTHEDYETGWPAILSSLKTLLETGKPMPMTTQRWGGPPKEAS